MKLFSCCRRTTTGEYEGERQSHFFLSTHLEEDIWDVLLVGRFTYVAQFGSIFRWQQAIITDQSHALSRHLIAFHMNLVLFITCRVVCMCRRVLTCRVLLVTARTTRQHNKKRKKRERQINFMSPRRRLNRRRRSHSPVTQIVTNFDPKKPFDECRHGFGCKF